MIRFRMVKINVLQFAILSENCEKSYKIETRSEFRNSIDGRFVESTATFVFIGKEEKAMILKIKCEFEIFPADLANITQDGKVVIPKDTLEHFLVHTVGTARGILHCKTEGTPFNVVILPPLDVTKLVPSDLITELPKE